MFLHRPILFHRMGLMLVAPSFHTLTCMVFACPSLPKVSIWHLQLPSPQTNHGHWEGKGNKWHPRAAGEYVDMLTDVLTDVSQPFQFGNPKARTPEYWVGSRTFVLRILPGYLVGMICFFFASEQAFEWVNKSG